MPIYCTLQPFSVQLQNFICQCFSVELFIASPFLSGASYTFKLGCRIPFSMRCVFSVLYIFSCCSGWSTNNCCSSLLGFGPLIKLVMYTCTKVAIKYWQSNLSIIPPCPGMVFAKSLILKALLNPLAKKPPNGPIKDANVERAMLCIWKGYKLTVSRLNTAFRKGGSE